MFNLLNEQWIPVKRKRSEKPEYISPSEITTGPADNPVIELAAPRPDFNGALIQFLIGLVQTGCPPENESEWQKKFRKPPTSEELKAAFEPFANAFNLDGDGPRFMQDLFIKDGIRHQIDQLMIDVPNDEMIKKNKDYFQKRDKIHHICQRCCTIALFTLQINAPQGGRGHYTSIRGGGPLTTIVLGDNLWKTIWFNVLSKKKLSRHGDITKNTDFDRFPWMKPGRSQDSGITMTSLDAHPVHAFWGMPRRINILFEKNSRNEECDVCGSVCNVHATQYIDKSYGISYNGGWVHPLSPYLIEQKTNEHIPRHKVQGGVTYQHWLGLVVNSASNNALSVPAEVIHTYREERSNSDDSSMRLWAFGYDMEKKKACCWYDGTMPLIHVEKELRPEYEALVSQLIKTSNLIASNVRWCLKKALFSPGTEVSLGKSFFDAIDSRFWQETEPQFYQTLADLKNSLETDQSLHDLKLRWLAIISNEGERLFDYYSQSNQISSVNPRRIALARRDFRVFSSKNNKKIIELLDLPKQEKKEPLKSPKFIKK